METRTKCDVIPVWMFRELDISAKNKLQMKIDSLTRAKNETIDNMKEEKEKLVWESVKGKKINECFVFDDYNLLNLNSQLKHNIKRKFEGKKVSVENQYKKEIDNIRSKYEQWKYSVLTGRIPRSRVKEFEV